MEIEELILWYTSVKKEGDGNDEHSKIFSY